MRIVYFAHSLTSCWNNGNAHFQRGLLSELSALGHRVTACEPANSWSLENLMSSGQSDPAPRVAALMPGVTIRRYAPREDAAALVDGADLVIVHEWNEPRLIGAIGALRRRGARFLLLYHDTHHRAVSEPRHVRQPHLADFDAILAFGASLADVYTRAGWRGRVFVLHEAADTRLFVPPDEDETAPPRRGLVWIGNWGDGERSDEISRYLLRPAAKASLPLSVYGVRYPRFALRALERKGHRYRGWLANADVPAVFALHLMTVHVPRRAYSERLPGIPTIRVFEALATGTPLLCAPWEDSEGLFSPGEDFLMCRTEAAMAKAMRAVSHDADLRAALAASGLARIRARHTCRHRAKQVLAIVARLETYRGAA